MRARIERLLSQSRSAVREISAQARVERRADRYWLSLQLQLDGRRARRELSDASCDSLSDVAAWLVAVAIDPQLPAPATLDAGSTPAAQVASPQPTAAAAAATATTTASTANDAERPLARDAPAGPARAPEYRIGVLGGLFAAGLAGPTGSLGVNASVVLDQFAFQLIALHHFARTLTPAAMSGRYQFASQELGLASCLHWGERLQLGPCVGLSGLRTHAEALGIAHPRPATFLWGIAVLSFAADYALLGPVRLRMDAGIWTPFTPRPRYAVSGVVGSVAEAAQVGGAIRLGAEAFW
jgi:hypothetical protein